MTIDEKKAKLSEHKKSIELLSNQWGCDKPVCRTNATSPTFGKVVVLFFADRGKIRTIGEILRKHHGMILRHLKTDLNILSRFQQLLFRAKNISSTQLFRTKADAV